MGMIAGPLRMAIARLLREESQVADLFNQTAFSPQIAGSEGARL